MVIFILKSGYSGAICGGTIAYITLQCSVLWTTWRLQSPANWLFFQQLNQSNIKANINPSVTGGFSSQMASYTDGVFISWHVNLNIYDVRTLMMRWWFYRMLEYQVNEIKHIQLKKDKCDDWLIYFVILTEYESSRYLNQSWWRIIHTSCTCSICIYHISAIIPISHHHHCRLIAL